MQAIVAAVWKQDNWFIAQCQAFDIATQAGSEGELIENVREAIALHLERAESDFDIVLEQAADAPVINIGPLAGLSFLQMRWKLEDAGFRGITQRPNHAKFIKSIGEAGDETISAILPHYTELAAPVLYSILRQARMQISDLD